MTGAAAVVRKILFTALALGGFALLVSVAPFGALRHPASESPRAVVSDGSTETARFDDRGPTTPAAECIALGETCPERAVELLQGFGLAGFRFIPEGAPPRTGPLPAIPGSTEIAQFRSPGLTLYLERPRDADLALELVALAFGEAGWSSPAESVKAPATPVETTRGAVYARGGELAVVTLEETPAPMLLIAYQGEPIPPEDEP